jgi:hypothetical protein
MFTLTRGNIMLGLLKLQSASRSEEKKLGMHTGIKAEEQRNGPTSSIISKVICYANFWSGPDSESCDSYLCGGLINKPQSYLGAQNESN